MQTTPTLLLAGAGDLAQRTAHLFLAHGGKVIGLRRNPPQSNGPIQWLRADLTQADSLSSLPDGISHVLYAPTPGERTESAYAGVFIHGLRNLLDALRQPLQRMVFVSSSAVYGPGDGLVNEDTPTEPERFNGKILVQAEQILQQRLTLPHQAVVLRLSGIYGPGRTGLLDRIRQGKAQVPAQGTHWSNRIHIKDAAGACQHLLTLPEPASCYLGTDSHPHPIDQLYDRLADMMQVAHPARSNAMPPSSGRKLDNQRLRDSGFVLQWPDGLQGYARLLETEQKPD